MSLTKQRITVAEYDEMIERGILTEQDRVELIHGEIVDKMPIGDLHAACVNRLNSLFSARSAGRYLVSIQNPVRLKDSDPEPDVALLKPRDDFYGTSRPAPADVLLLIEVADSSLDYDRDIKGPLYAEAGITEYWIVNVIDRTVEVHRSPTRNAGYEIVWVAREHEAIDLLTLPGSAVSVNQIF